MHTDDRRHKKSQKFGKSVIDIARIIAMVNTRFIQQTGYLTFRTSK